MVGTIEQSGTEKVLDYNVLAQELRSKSDFWKPKPSKYSVFFLGGFCWLGFHLG